jgi:hypothetical protein
MRGVRSIVRAGPCRRGLLFWPLPHRALAASFHVVITIV